MELPYISSKNIKIPPMKNYIIYAVCADDLWMWNPRKFNNHDMALMLIDILYSRNLINEATYRKIIKKNLN